MTVFRRGVISVLLASAVAAPAAGAQQEATITGRVTDRATGAPVAEANVAIIGTQRGDRSNEQGRYRIAGVAAGTYTLRVSRLGYSALTRQVTVAGPGETAADFALAVTAATIDQVVVTATGQQERKRENGNDVGIIKPGEDVSLAATPNLTSVIAARTPGLTVTQNMGTPGTSARIRIRGSNSVSLSNEPLLIVDGVRVENNVTGFNLGVGGATTNRFDDLNAEDIETIEVLKGPAASALYGTAAANGVIQITTRRGRSGRTKWRTSAEYGQMTDVTPYQPNYYNVGTALTGSRAGQTFGGSCTIDRRTQGQCRADSLFAFNPAKFYGISQTGTDGKVGLSASGGGDQAQYYIGADMQRTQGIAAPNKVRHLSLRANLSGQLRPNLNSTITTTYIDRGIRLPYNDNNIYGMVPNAVLGRAFNCAPGATGAAALVCGRDTLSRGFYSALPSTFYFVTSQQLVKRFIGGSTTTWQPLSWLTGVVQGGLDVDNTLDERLTPANVVTFINSSLTEGDRSQYRRQNLNYSANTSLTATHQLPMMEALTTSTSLGMQYINEQQHYTFATGRALVPGTGSLATVGAGKNVDESNQTIVTVGGYAREQLGWRDRLFLTGSIRADENSAFGKDFKLAYYPSVSASWVVSEEPFFRERSALGWLNQLRLRTSYGQSGQRPGFRQADTYLSGVSVADKGGAELTAVVLGGTGNPKLKPEVSAENELGFDMSFLDNRLGLIYTHYAKTTRDALIASTLAPSLGATTTQFVNLGKVYNSGNELSLNAALLNRSAVKLDLTVAASTNSNKLLALGGVPPIVFNGGNQRHQEGYPLGAFFAQHYTYADKNGDRLISRDEVTYGDTSSASQYIGAVLPRREVSVSPTVTLFKDLRVTSLFQHRGGNYVYNNTEEFRCTASAFSNCRAANDPTAPLEDQAAMIARLTKPGQPATSYGYIEKGDFWKLRELAATYTLPQRLTSRLRTQGLSVTVAGRNLRTWTRYKGFDPEVNASQQNFTQFDFLTQPPVRMWTARLDVNF